MAKSPRRVATTDLAKERSTLATAGGGQPELDQAWVSLVFYGDQEQGRLQVVCKETKNRKSVRLSEMDIVEGTGNSSLLIILDQSSIAIQPSPRSNTDIISALHLSARKQCFSRL